MLSVPMSQLFDFHISKSSRHISVFFYVGLACFDTITHICQSKHLFFGFRDSIVPSLLLSFWLLFLSFLFYSVSTLLPSSTQSLKVGSSYCCLLFQGSQNFSVNRQIVIILGFVEHMVSLATIELDCCSKKAAIHTTWMSETVFLDRLSCFLFYYS